MASRKPELIHGELKVSTESRYEGKKPSSLSFPLSRKHVRRHLIYGVSYRMARTPRDRLCLRYERLSAGGTGGINEVCEF